MLNASKMLAMILSEPLDPLPVPGPFRTEHLLLDHEKP